MKLTQIIAAGLLMAGVGVSTEASAQPGRGYEQNHRGDRDGRWDNRGDRDGRWDRRDDRRDWRRNRRDHRWGRHDNGNHYGWRNNRNCRDCRIVYRHGQRVQICR